MKHWQYYLDYILFLLMFLLIFGLSAKIDKVLEGQKEILSCFAQEAK